MPTEKAKPGDRIRATTGSIMGTEYTVVECPAKNQRNPNVRDVIWVEVGRIPCTIEHGEYEIIFRVGESQVECYKQCVMNK